MLLKLIPEISFVLYSLMWIIITVSLITSPYALDDAFAITEFTPFQNISNSPTDSIGPFVVTDGTNIFITWSEFTSGNKGSDIFFSKSTDGGNTFSSPKNISQKQGNSIVPSIVIDDTTLFITWTYRYQEDSHSEIFFSKSTDEGATFSTPQKISKDSSFSSLSDLAVNDDDDVFLTWFDITYSDIGYENMEVFFSKSTDEGATFSTPLNLSNNGGFSSHPSIVNNGKTIFIVWQDDSQGIGDIFVIKSTDGGATFGTPQNISNSDDGSVGADIITDGTNIFVTWFEFSKGSGDIFFSKSTDGGTTFSVPHNISHDKVNSITPFMITDGTNLFVTWTDATLKGSWVNFSNSSNGGTTFSVPQRISNDKGFSAAQSIATDGTNLFVAWNYNQSPTSQHDILFSKSKIKESLTKESSEQISSIDESKQQSDTNQPVNSESNIPNYTLGTIEWVDSIPFIGGYGVVRLVDPDMNKNPELVDVFKAHAWSTTDKKGIDLDMVETNKNTGIFYIDITFSSKKSAIQLLETSPRDMVTVSYLDLTTPDGKEIELTDTVTIISEHMPSHKQLKSGILPENIKCKDDMELIFKHSDGSPACVTPETKTKLLERGWDEF